MTQEPQYGAGLWHFAQYVDRYATDAHINLWARSSSN